MKVAILGSGFGLYGYLPAIQAGCGERVVLPKRYRERLDARHDVRSFADQVEWAEDDAAALAAADAAIVAQRPEDQIVALDAVFRGSNIDRVLLEKPIGGNPELAETLLDSIADNGRTVRVGYTFRYMPWAKRLIAWCAAMGPKGQLAIDWRFRAHHDARGLVNWKRTVSTGGGAVRFYGIQLIALLAEIGYRAVAVSRVSAARPDEAERWHAVITGPGLPNCTLNVGSNEPRTVFDISGYGPGIAPILVGLADPFDAPPNGVLDRRIPVLTALCRELLYDPTPCYEWYRGSIDLWAEVERQTQRTPN